MRYMCDSTNIADDPTSFQLVAYYCDGNFAVSPAAVRARFPTATLVPVSAVGTNSGIVGDCEPGCMTYDGLVTWVVERRAAGLDPTGYINEQNGWVPARLAFAKRGVPEPHWWVADYDGLDVIPPGAVAKQDMNSVQTGGHFDRSVVADFWPGVDGAFGMSGGAIGGQDGLNATDFKALVILAYIGASMDTRAPESQAAIDAWAKKYDGTNADQLIAGIVDSPEFLADRATANRLLTTPAEAPEQPGPAGPQGSQGIPGPAGSPGVPGLPGAQADPSAVEGDLLSRIFAAIKAALHL